MADELHIPENINNPGLANDDDDDSEWEYEYHEAETETFYVSIDMSSFSSNVRSKRKPNPPNSSTADDTLQSTTATHDANSSHAQRTPSNPTEAIQILDLHTSNPLVSYQSRLFTCTWSTTLGTDLLLTSLPSPNSPILAATRIKLSARPVRLLPNHGASKHPLPSGSREQTQKAVAETSSTGKVLSTTQPPAFKFPVEMHSTLARQNQAQFLEWIIAAKAARGDQDKVTIHAKKRYMGTGWRARQNYYEEMERNRVDESEGENQSEDTGEERQENENEDGDEDENDDDDDDDDDEDEDEDDDDVEEDHEDGKNDDHDDDKVISDRDCNELESEPQFTRAISTNVPNEDFGRPARRGRVGRPRKLEVEGDGLFRDYIPVRKPRNGGRLSRKSAPSASAVDMHTPNAQEQLAPISEQSPLISDMGSAAIAAAAAAPTARAAEAGDIAKRDGEGGDVLMEDG